MKDVSLTVRMPSGEVSSSYSEKSVLDHCLSNVVRVVIDHIHEEIGQLKSGIIDQGVHSLNYQEIFGFYESIRSNFSKTYNWEDLIFALEEASKGICTFSDSPFQHDSELNLAKIGCLQVINTVLDNELNNVKVSISDKFDKETIKFKLLLMPTEDLIDQLETVINGMAGGDEKTRSLKSIKQALLENINDYLIERPSVQGVLPVEQIIQDLENNVYSNVYDLQIARNQSAAGRFWFQFRPDNKFVKVQRLLDINYHIIDWIDQKLKPTVPMIRLKDRAQLESMRIYFVDQIESGTLKISDIDGLLHARFYIKDYKIKSLPLIPVFIEPAGDSSAKEIIISLFRKIQRFQAGNSITSIQHWILDVFSNYKGKGYSFSNIKKNTDGVLPN